MSLAVVLCVHGPFKAESRCCVLCVGLAPDDWGHGPKDHAPDYTLHPEPYAAKTLHESVLSDSEKSLLPSYGFCSYVSL